MYFNSKDDTNIDKEFNHKIKFTTTDGIHYDSNTYKQIYNLVMNCI